MNLKRPRSKQFEAGVSSALCAVVGIVISIHLAGIATSGAYARNRDGFIAAIVVLGFVTVLAIAGALNFALMAINTSPSRIVVFAETLTCWSIGLAASFVLIADGKSVGTSVGSHAVSGAVIGAFVGLFFGSKRLRELNHKE